jgi:hypothetical protein
VPFQDQPGALARAVFHAFDAGMPLTEIVKSYAVEPERVRELYTEYITACGEPLPVEFTPKQILEREELAFKAQAERNRVELARERAHAASQRRREG